MDLSNEATVPPEDGGARALTVGELSNTVITAPTAVGELSNTVITAP